MTLSHAAADLPAFAGTADMVTPGGPTAASNRPITRHDAMLADLFAVRDALDNAAIDYLIVRSGADDRPILAIDRARRDDVAAALAAAFADAPVYARTDRSVAGASRRREQAPLALGELPGSAHDNAFLIFTRRPASARPGWKHRDAAVRLHFWEWGPDEVIAPAPTALTRERFAVADLEYDTVERHGALWPTLAGMYDTTADDFPYPIDIVFSWVDGSSPDYVAERARYLAEYDINAEDTGQQRYRQIDELRYAMRSVWAFAPWIRHIFIATDSEPPAWLDTDHPSVTVVRSHEFFADPTVLPIFNSHAVECQLHRIPGLSEHFLYSNDDMFFGRPVQPSHFFTPAGVSQFVESELRIGIGEPGPHLSGHDNAMRVNRALLKERFGRSITRHLEHCAVPLTKSVMAELESAFPEDFARTAASRFRSPTDISVTNSLAPYYGLLTGRAVTQPGACVEYVHTTLASAPDQLRRLERARDVDMFCLNDGSERELDEDTRVRLVTEFLERYYPVPGPWERDADVAC